ncbi:MAG: guanylate kinase [Actinomycetota bacterium]
MSGPSGAGKGTIVSRLVAADARLWLSRSWTTRARRESEAVDAYVWVDEETFRAHADRGGFLEWAVVYGDLKGTPMPDPPPGRDVVLEIDLQGAHQIRALHPDALIVFIAPPSREEQERRLRWRGDPEDDVQRRLAKADAEEEVGRAMADAVIVNDDVDRAVAEIQTLISSRR